MASILPACMRMLEAYNNSLILFTCMHTKSWTPVGISKRRYQKWRMDSIPSNGTRNACWYFLASLPALFSMVMTL
jgi:hypothetical protein